MSILPTASNLIITAAADNESEYTLNVNTPLLKEYAWNFESDTFLLEDGRFIVVDGIEALKVRAYKKLKTSKNRYLLIYSKDYGNTLEDDMIGKSASEENKTKIKKIINECLIDGTYINSIDFINMQLDEDMMTISIRLNTIYGSIDMEGVDIS